MAETAPQSATAVRVVGVGHIALDHHFTVDAAPAPGRKTAARSYRRLVGGMTANALVAAARLGAQAELFSPVGDDEAVPDFRAHLQREGGSMTRVAEKTGLERTHLYRKLKQLGVDLSRNKRNGG